MLQSTKFPAPSGAPHVGNVAACIDADSRCATADSICQCESRPSVIKWHIMLHKDRYLVRSEQLNRKHGLTSHRRTLAGKFRPSRAATMRRERQGHTASTMARL